MSKGSGSNMKGRSRGSTSGFTKIQQREIGLARPRTFPRRIAGSEVFVRHLDLYGTLDGHDGCVNTVHFNSSGDVLVSGSDDMEVIFWDWAMKAKILKYPSGHLDNIFQARIMPFTDDRIIITSAADGQVRLGEIAENGEVTTKRLARHEGRVHKLAIEPGSPHIFYSCGEDGVVHHFDLRSHSSSRLFSCSSFAENQEVLDSVSLNAIVIDPRNPNYFAVGGFDELARIYDIRYCQKNEMDRPVNVFSPLHLIGKEEVHITGLAYSNTSELLVSYNDELIYSFQNDMGLGANPRTKSTEELEKIDKPQVYTGHRNSRTVKGVSFFGPNDEYVVSGSDCGHIFIWKKKGGELLRLISGDRHVVNCLEPHPNVPILATSGIDKDVKLWAPMAADPIPLPENVNEIMETNKLSREKRARVCLSPDVIMHLLSLHRRQASLYVEQRNLRREVASDEEEDGEAFLMGFEDGEGSSEEESTGNPAECNIS